MNLHDPRTHSGEVAEYLAANISICKGTEERAPPATKSGKPRVILVVAPCRSGTTALSRAIAYANVPVLYQKVKEALRLSLRDRLGNQLSQKERDYFHVNSTIPQSLSIPDHPVLFMKETFGGAHPLESYFDPLSVLLKAGWHGEDITLVTMLREPLATFASWVKNWGHIASRKQLLQNYHYAMEAIKHAEVLAEKHNIKVVPLDFELLGRACPSEFLHYLFRECNVRRSAQTIEKAVHGWSSLPNFLESDIGMLMPKGQSHISYLKSVHSALVKSDGLRYTRAPTHSLEATLTDPEVSPSETQRLFDGVYSHNAFHKQHQRRTAVRKANIPPHLNPMLEDGVLKPHLAALVVTVCFASYVHLRPAFWERLPSSPVGLDLHHIPFVRLVLPLAQAAIVYALTLILVACQGPVHLYHKWMGYRAFLAQQNTEFRNSKLYVNEHQLPALCFGLVTSPFRTLPNVQIIGAQKSATTTLHAMLVKNHTDIVCGSLAKESHFMDGRSVFGDLIFTSPLPSLLYRSFFPTVFKKLAHFLYHGSELQVVDCTPVNVFLESAPITMKKFCKNSKCIAILREPVERIKSHFRHNLNWGREKTHSLEEALAQEEHLWKMVETGEKAHRIMPSVYLDKSYIRRSKYIEQIRRYEIWFGKENILLLSFSEVTERPEEAYSKCCAFLGLDQGVNTGSTSKHVEHRNKTPALNVEPTPSDTAKLLMESFRENNGLLASEFGFHEGNRWNLQYDTFGAGKRGAMNRPAVKNTTLPVKI